MSKHWRHAQWNASQWHQSRRQQQRDFEDAHTIEADRAWDECMLSERNPRQKNKSAEEVGSVAAREAWVSRRERRPRVRCSSRDTTHTGDSSARAGAHTGQRNRARRVGRAPLSSPRQGRWNLDAFLRDAGAGVNHTACRAPWLCRPGYFPVVEFVYIRRPRGVCFRLMFHLSGCCLSAPANLFLFFLTFLRLRQTTSE